MILWSQTNYFRIEVEVRCIENVFFAFNRYICIKNRRTMYIFKDIITIEVGKKGGKPCIRGMRISVEDILRYLASDMSFEDILQDFPELTKEDILAALEFSANRSKRTLIAA